MSDISRAALFGKLDPLLYQSIEAATVFCKLRGNPYVELVHWLHPLLNANDGDLQRIIRHFDMDAARLSADVTRALDRLPRGATAISDLSEHIEQAVERAWVYGTLKYGAAQVRGAYLMVGIVKTQGLRHLLYGISREFEKMGLDALSDHLPEIVNGSPEDGQSAQDGSGLGQDPGEAPGAMAPGAKGAGQALKTYTVDLTDKARKGELDPVTGRDEEIRQIVDILMRRRQNNPLLTGEAGVGKTAVVEGFALRLARGDVPPSLREVSLLTLDIGLLQAGASMKGEFEQRLRQVIDEVQSSPQPIILFVDEVHTLVGAGGAAGTGDAANLLKPALARGTLRTIGATTWAEYKKYIEQDPALTRRFQVVQVPEPDERKAVAMLRGVAQVLEKHHQVLLLDEAMVAAVQLSHRYIPARQLPDKAVSLLDTSCARVAVSQHATPAAVENQLRRRDMLDVEIAICEREAAVGINVAERLSAARTERDSTLEQLALLETRWQQEKDLVAELLGLRAQLSHPVAEAASEEQRASQLNALEELQTRLSALQGESPLILPAVDAQAVASVVADWTGIPVGRMVKNEVEAMLTLADTLNRRVIGQRHGLELIARRIQTSRARLDNPGKPVGVFLLVGPSGVGKTETALTLAETLYGGEQNLITINMSEFQEAHTVSTLKGAPPGYVGYGQGGVLTEAVRRKPYSVVLLDEVEKAHPDVHEIFFQVFDKGVMEDGEGRMIDFKNTVIILTSNVGSDLVMSMMRDPELLPDPDDLAKALRAPLLKVFPAALLGRLQVIPYYPLSDDMLGNIVRLQLGRIQRRIAANHQAEFSYTEAVVALIASRCSEPESGGRMIDAILTNTILPRLSEEILLRLKDGQGVKRMALDVADGDFSYAYA